MQTLIVENKTINVVRTFHNGVGKALLCEFPDGSWGYPNMDKVTKMEEVEFVPPPHRRRAERWIQATYKTRNEESVKDGELNDMSVAQLQVIAGDKTENRKTKLIEAIQAKQDAK